MKRLFSVPSQRRRRSTGDMPDLGTCCDCLKRGPTVRNILCLPVRAPVPGTGWGCLQCGLPNDGAVAVICDECLQKEGAAPGATIDDTGIRWVVKGYPTGKGRRERSLCTVPFLHDTAKHPGEERTPAEMGAEQVPVGTGEGGQSDG